MWQADILLSGPEDTARLARVMAACLEKSLVIGLVGNLGAGKTTFVQSIAAGLNVAELVSSPTFLMLNEYHSGLLPIYHFDLYRLQEDLNTGSPAAANLKAELDEIMASPFPVLVLIEWIDLWEEFAAQYDELRIELSYTSQDADNLRQAVLYARGVEGIKLLERCQAKLAEEEALICNFSESK